MCIFKEQRALAAVAHTADSSPVSSEEAQTRWTDFVVKYDHG